MNKAKDVDELIQKLAASLWVGQSVRHDIKHLTYGVVYELQSYAQNKYIEM